MIRKYSVVIPLFNKEKHIERALHSAIRALAGYPSEIIIVNDGSTDYGPKIVEPVIQHANNIRLYSQPNQGVSAARNRGMRMASNEFILLLDADDEWTPEFVEIIDRLITKFPHAALYGTAYLDVWAEGKGRSPKYHNVPSSADGGVLISYFDTLSKVSAPIWSSAVCIRKSVLEQVGGFPEGVHHGEDKIFWARVAKDYPVAWTKQVGAYRYRNAENRSNSSWRAESATAYLEEIEGFLKLPDLSPALKTDLNKSITAEKKWLCKQMILNGYKRDAFQYLKQVIRENGFLDNYALLMRFLSPRWFYSVARGARNLTRRI